VTLKAIKLLYVSVVELEILMEKHQIKNHTVTLLSVLPSVGHFLTEQ